MYRPLSCASLSVNTQNLDDTCTHTVGLERSLWLRGEPLELAQQHPESQESTAKPCLVNYMWVSATFKQINMQFLPPPPFEMFLLPPSHRGSVCCQEEGCTTGSGGCGTTAAAAADCCCCCPVLLPLPTCGSVVEGKAAPRCCWMRATTWEQSGKSPTTTTAMWSGVYLRRRD